MTGRWIVYIASVLCVSGAWSAQAHSLLDALAWTPSDLEDPLVAFTDWDAIKGSLGVPWLTGEASQDVKIEFLRRLDQDYAAASAYGLFQFLGHRESWGFDTVDLAWEAEITSSGLPPTYVLKLPDGFDLARVVDRFVERGFTQTGSGRARIYSHPIDLDADWIGTSELSIHNVGVLEEERILVLSSAYRAVELLLGTYDERYASLDEIEGAVEVVESLGPSFSAYVLFGISTCLRFSATPSLGLLIEAATQTGSTALEKRFSGGSPLLPYRAFGVGYAYESGHPTGRIAFVYEDPEDAFEDLAARRQIAENGRSDVWERPLAEAYFTVDRVAAVGSSILFDVHPAAGQPRRLFQMVVYADAPFAACR